MGAKNGDSGDGSGARASAASSSFVSLRARLAVMSGDGRASSSRIILPFSLPLNFSMSASVWMGAITGSPVSVPFVPGDHGRAKPISGEYCGSFMWAVKRTQYQVRPNGPHFSSLAFDKPHSLNRRTAHSAFSSSSRINPFAPSSRDGSSAISRCASRMAPCSPSPRLRRICSNCSTDSLTAASRRAISDSTSSGGMWNRGTRARRRSTVKTRPIATPGAAGIPVSFAKAPAGLSQARKLHLQPAQFFVCLEKSGLSLFLGEL